nr:immunoglobulin heavy chain junction region [Mus musculus]
VFLCEILGLLCYG